MLLAAIPGHWGIAVGRLHYLYPSISALVKQSLNHDKLAWGCKAYTDSPEITLRVSGHTLAAVRLEIRDAFRRMFYTNRDLHSLN